jgi:hypothetical protein
VNSVVKRKMGDNIYSRKVKMQNRELDLRYIAYNARRSVQLGLSIFLCEDFYRALSPKSLYISIYVFSYGIGEGLRGNNFSICECNISQNEEDRRNENEENSRVDEHCDDIHNGLFIDRLTEG